MNNIKRYENLQKAVKLQIANREGKTVTEQEWNDTVVDLCIHMHELMKENAELKAKIQRQTLKAKNPLHFLLS